MCVSILDPLHFYTYFRISLSVCVKPAGILILILLNIWINLRINDIVVILSLLIHEYNIPFFDLGFLQFLSTIIYSFQCTYLVQKIVKFFLKCFISLKLLRMVLVLFYFQCLVVYSQYIEILLGIVFVACNFSKLTDQFQQLFCQFHRIFNMNNPVICEYGKFYFSLSNCMLLVFSLLGQNF